MDNFEEILRHKNLKKTSLRLALLEVFSSQHEPITIGQIEKLLLKKNISQNATSLYRQMEVLVASGIVQSVVLKNSTAYFELQEQHHHHFVCDACQKIECISDDDLEKQIVQLEKKLIQKGFVVSSHQFSFHGKCTQCQ